MAHLLICKRQAARSFLSRLNLPSLRFAIHPLLFASMSDGTPAIGIIGGSGLYQIEGLEEPEELVVDTPFGEPSDSLVSGHMNDRRLYFLPRHARGHRLLPTELNH